MRRRTSEHDGRARPAKAAPFRRRVVVMVKSPRMGRVKTRLGRDIGAVEATRFYRVTAAAVLGRLGRDPRWETVLAVAPDTDTAASYWPSHLRRQAQGPGDLGRRMQRIMDRMPPGPVLIVGTDIPAVQPQRIAEAFQALRRGTAVFGPASDGGYWLVGLRRSPRVLRIFAGVRWSSEHALADTCRNIADGRATMAAMLGDVDGRPDLDAARPWLGRRLPPASKVCHQTG